MDEGASEAKILMATVGAPHGVRGAVKLTVFAEDPLGLKRYNPFETRDGRRFKLKSVKPIGKAIVAEVEGVADRNAAEALRGVELFVPRRRLPRPDEDEFYHVDLIGLEAVTVTGEPLGRVKSVNDYGAGDILEIVGTRTVLVPFTRAIVPEVDLAAGTLLVDPPAGLLDDTDEPPPDWDGEGSADGR